MQLAVRTESLKLIRQQSAEDYIHAAHLHTQLCNFSISQSCGRGAMHKIMLQLVFKTNIQMGEKCPLCGKVVGTRWACWSISESANLLEFSHTIVSRVYTE